MNKGRKFLSDLKLYSDFLGFNEDLQRYETWDEATKEVFNTHRVKYSEFISKSPKLKNYIKYAEELYKDKKYLASQRSLQFRGKDMFKHNFKMFNCLVMYADKPSFLGNAFYLMLCGCGVGVNMMIPFVNCLPKIQKRTKGTKTYIVKDSIEGWGDAAHVLITSYLNTDPIKGFEEYQGYEIKFDYSKIRKRGEKVGRKYKAPGPEGIRKSFEKIEFLLNSYVTTQPKKFKSILAYDFFMHLANAVLSGGIRRAACNILISPEDKELIYAKTGNWRELNQQRERSNNSVGLLRNKFTKEKFEHYLKLNNGVSDIGFVFINNIYEIFNPCITGDTWVTTESGAKQVKDIIGKKLKILKDGRFYETTDKGFFETGYQEVWELELSRGNKIKSTYNHQFLTQEGWKELKDITLNDKIILSDNKGVKFENGGGNKEEGWLIGNLIGDGTYSNEYSPKIQYWGDNKFELKKIAYTFLKSQNLFSPSHNEILEDTKYSKIYNKTCIDSKKLGVLAKKWGVIRGNKYLTEEIERGSSNFYKGILGGLFDADGCVTLSNGGMTAEIAQSNKPLLERAQRMLSRLGIISTISLSHKAGRYKLPSTDFYKDGSLKFYDVKDGYILRVSNKTNVDLFFKLLFIQDQNKINKYKKISQKYYKVYKDKKYSKVKSITFMGKEIVYDCNVPETSCFDANGIITHNCHEICFTPLYFDWKDQSIINRVQKSDINLLKDPNFITAIQCCNLVEINGADIKNKQQLMDVCKAATITGTLQAGYVDFKYIKDILKETIAISKKESLLGVSITGWANQPWLFNEKLLQEGAKVVIETNQIIADLIGINPSARSTTVKPSGNSSVILGCASGIHFEHSKNYFRVMQLNKDTETAIFLEKNMPYLIEEGVYSETATDYAVFIPISNPKNTLYKNDIKGVKHLELIRLVKENWVDYGKVEERCIIPTTSHNVSNTVIIDDYESITNYVFKHQNSFAAISFLSIYGDKDWNQSPNTSVLNFQELIEKYGIGAIFASGLIVDGLHYFNNNLWEACDMVLNKSLPIQGTRSQVLLKKHWIDSAKRFARNYFKRDLQTSIYCLKDVHLLHKWEETKRKFKPVDFTEILKKPKYIDVDTLGAVSCSGVNGEGCEINSI